MWVPPILVRPYFLLRVFGARRRRDRPESRSTGVAATGVNQPSKSNTLRRAMWVFQTVMGEWAGVFDGSSASLHTSKRGGFLGG